MRAAEARHNPVGVIDASSSRSFQEKEAITVADLSGVRVTGPLQGHARGFSEQLTELGYTRLPAADQLRLMAHLSRWLASRGLDAGQLTPQRIEQFLRACGTRLFDLARPEQCSGAGIIAE
jgi:hypothetical protein